MPGGKTGGAPIISPDGLPPRLGPSRCPKGPTVLFERFAATRLVAVLTGLTVCFGAASERRQNDQAPLAPIADARLHNAYRVTEKVISGAQPEGEASFEALAA